MIMGGKNMVMTEVQAGRRIGECGRSAAALTVSRRRTDMTMQTSSQGRQGRASRIRAARLGAASPASWSEQGSTVIEKAAVAGRMPEFLGALSAADERFRSTIVMARHGFGKGEYKYLSR